MQIRLTRDLEDKARASGRMSVDRFLARFPEVPRDGGGDAPHFFYTRLVNDLAIYGVGLAKRDRTLQRLERLLAEYRAQPATFACTLVPRQAPNAPRAGCR